jgi:hypothetical protein
MAWDVVRVTWDHPERRGTVHDLWREHIVATCPTIGEARAVTAEHNRPGTPYLWLIRWAATASPAGGTANGVATP